MESSTPLTRCSTCQTVFEVPQSILDSIDSRVRCGECLTIFDASENLHMVERPDLTIPEPIAERFSGEKFSERSHHSTGMAGAGAAALSSDFEEFTSSLAAASALGTDKGAGQGTHGSATGTVAGDHKETAADSTFDQTQVEMELFSADADLPVANFEDSTIDAIRLDFDVLDDFADETISQTMFQQRNNAGLKSDVNSDSTSGEEREQAAGVDDAARGDATQADSTSNSVFAETGHAHSAAIEDDDILNVTASTQSTASVDSDAAVGADSNDDTSARLANSISRRRAVRIANAGFPGAAKTGFTLDDGDDQPIVEFDFRGETLSGDADGSDQTLANDQTSATHASDDTIAVTPLASGHSAHNVVELAARARLKEQKQRDARGNQRASAGGKMRRWTIRAILAIVILALLAGLYAVRHRHHLADKPLIRPAYSLWCLATGCEVQPRLDTSKLAVVSKQIFSHPTRDDALVITLVIRNTANFEQRFPKLFLWLSDRARRTVASNEFEPSEYLPENNMPLNSKLGVGEQQRISLDVFDPGDDAVSLELTFR